MKDIARMALKEGMEIAADVTSFHGDVIVKAGTKVDDAVIMKLTRYDIMLVTIMEDVDYAVTYFEKIRLSDKFKEFEKEYKSIMPKYKQIMNDILASKEFDFVSELMSIYNDIDSVVRDKDNILDFLYNMLPTEDDMTYAHCLNSALIAGVFARWLNFSPEETETLILCGFFYDIGKLMLPHELIWKPDKLTPIEFAKIKTHTILGFQAIQDLPLSGHILKATLSHHEKYDGSGYPSRLHDVQIDQFARIIGIIDAYEAMTSARTYRPSKHPFQVIEIFEQDIMKYDMIVLNTLLFNLANHMVGLKVLLSNDVKAEVVLINRNKLSRPLLKDDNGCVVDLTERSDLKIMGIY